jgi:hypothetical protein
MTVISHSHQISTGLPRSCQQESFATCSFTSGFKGYFVTFLQVVGSFYVAPHPLNSFVLVPCGTVLVACGDLFYPLQPSAVLQCP